MDKYIGESFLSTDYRSEGRVIRILKQALRPGHYRYITVANPLNPGRVGKRRNISAKTLDADWKKISH